MTTIKVELEGIREMQEKLARAGEYTDEALEAAIFTEAQLIMTESKRRVPVDTGALRASGQVEKPEWSGTEVSVTLGFGNTAAPYAEIVHENPRSGKTGGLSPDGKPYTHWARTGSYKFLEQPLMEATAGMLGRIADRIKRAIR